MTQNHPDQTHLSTEQIEELLGRSELPADERSALVDELTRRVAQELLDGPGPAGPPPPRGAPRTHPQPPPRQTAPPRPGPPPPQGAQAMAPPVHAPVGPPAERRRGFSRFRAALLSLVVVIGAALAVLALAGTDSVRVPDGGGDTGSEVTGPSGTAQVTWTLDGVDYEAELETDGTSGVAEVTYLDPLTATMSVVQQDLVFERASGGYTYTGSNARDAATGAAVDYLPDTFWLEPGADGWEFTQVCDALSRCMAVSTS